jgi:RNA polymerase sigma-70 factor (ECF subfamily)
MVDLLSADALKQASTKVIIQLVRSGDREAFAALIGRHDNMIRRTAYAILKNMEDTEDIAQEVRIRVFMKINTFEGTSAFSTWLTRIVINTSLMRLRQRRSRPVTSLEDLVDGDGSCFLPLATSGLNPEQQCATSQLKKRLHEAVSRLPATLRDVARDHIYGELPIRELALKRGLSVAAAKSRAYRARKMLAGSLTSMPSASFRRLTK